MTNYSRPAKILLSDRFAHIIGGKELILLFRKISSVLLILILFTLAAAPALADNTMQQGSMYVNTANGKALRFRSSQSTSEDNILTEIPYGTKVFVLSWNGSWARIRYNSAVGYVVKKHLSIARPEPYETVAAQRAQAAAEKQEAREIRAANAKLDRSKLRSVPEYDVTVRIGVAAMTVPAYTKADLGSAVAARYEDGARLTVQASNKSWAKVYDGASDRTGYMLLEDLESDLVEEELLDDDDDIATAAVNEAAGDTENGENASEKADELPASSEPTPVPEGYYDDLYLDEDDEGV